QGKLVEAEAQYRLILQFEETLLGTDHPGTLASMVGIATLFYEQGRDTEAEIM
ncbi:hypothetical protein L207DRAFT_431598, partial [Hyaloscypha variabilis F]